MIQISRQPIRKMHSAYAYSRYFTEPSRGPNIINITDVKSKSMKVSWEKLSNDDSNGVITKYEVCYKASEDTEDIDCNLKKNVNNGNTLEVTLDGLNVATTYNNAVKASTQVAFGELGNVVTNKTLEASKLL